MYYLVWFGLAFAVGVIADNKGRFGIGWFALGCIISPLLSFLILIAIGDDAEGKEKMAIKSGDFKACPFCAEAIKPAAIVCKHCGKDIPAT